MDRGLRLARERKVPRKAARRASDLLPVQRAWDRAAEMDALFTVCSDPGKYARQWDVPTFLATGEEEIGRVFAYFDSRSIPLGTHGDALDFGCGVGRLSAALATRFDKVVGLDISPVMIARARELHSSRSTVSFLVNDRSDLRHLPPASFAFVYSNIVLQHLPPPLTLGYIREFIRVLAPSGHAVFQVPDDWRLWLLHALPGATWMAAGARRVLGKPRVASGTNVEWRLCSVPEAAVRRIVELAGGKVLDVTTTNATCPGFNGRLEFNVGTSTICWRSKQYCAQRPA